MIEFVNLDLAELWQGTQETLILTGVSLFFTVLLGIHSKSRDNARHDQTDSFHF